MKTIAILGCGSIGTLIARRAEGFRVTAVHDELADPRRALSSLCGAADCPTFEALLAQEVDLVVEAASADAVRDYAPIALAGGTSMAVLSTGALLDTEFRTHLTDLARDSGARLHLPSGAVAGLDVLKVGRIEPLDALELRTTKPAHALGVTVDTPTRLFRGSASECVARYPRNINVAASVSLAAGRECEVEIWADPAATSNRHQIEARGPFGNLRIEVNNQPSPDNPRTSYLAALSVLALIERLNSPLEVGT